ncbi:MAG: hypothetical protein OXC69_01630 [Candidatus Tectomicrobia bacterium]|nr:hypothetical protein [Candidatus Tectomicrobia bacterium]
MHSGTRTDRVILVSSLLAAAYFAFIALDSFLFKLEWILLGLILELLTIPLILAVAVLFILSMARLLATRQSINARNVGSVLILFVLNCLIWGL